MSKPILEIQNLSKLYNLYQIKKFSFYEAAGYGFARLRGESVPQPWKIKRNHLSSKIPHELGPRVDTFWALKDVSFTLNPGEILAVFGNNGAGKTTLMKIISKIKPPTSGRVILRGRVSSTLASGVGFHTELSGRQNIYLNGAIMGIRKSEIDSRLERIIDFSEIGGFIDSPIKCYSSGMSLRLGFAIATHFSPEILVLDEAFSVGDEYFQRKSMEKIKRILTDGCSVIFVTHAASQAEMLSKSARGILLKAGKLAVIGTAQEAGQAYLSDSSRSIPIKPR